MSIKIGCGYHVGVIPGPSYIARSCISLLTNFMASILVATLLGIAAVQASPTLVSSQTITALATSQIDAFSPYTYFAKAAYCTPSTTISWSCGVSCDNNPGFEPVASGGNGDSIQYWYVGYDPSLNTVIVAHQGTNFSHFMAVLTDADFILGGLDSSLFPGLSSDIKVHSGFRNEQSLTASDILSSVQTAISKYGTNSVTLVGHFSVSTSTISDSCSVLSSHHCPMYAGAALSLLDSVYLPLHLPSGTTFRTVLYGLPRVGNKALADYVDANLQNVMHINNLKDPVPIIPPRFMEYVHPSGEVHIRETGEWASCPGQDNPSKECIVGDVPNILMSDPANHDGPYNGIDMHCTS
ncbi:hypothetical protein V8E55_005373 [Tylopilus felleus]